MSGRGLNKVTLIGHLGKDPEMKYAQSGQAVTNFSLATTDSWQDKEGKKQERTEWHKIVVFGKLGEICNQWLSKGKQIYVEGRLQTREWQDKDGNKRYTTEIVVNEMLMLGSRSEGSTGPRSSKGDGPPEEPPPPDYDNHKDDIPF